MDKIQDKRIRAKRRAQSNTRRHDAPDRPVTAPGGPAASAQPMAERGVCIGPKAPELLYKGGLKRRPGKAANLLTGRPAKAPAPLRAG